MLHALPRSCIVPHCEGFCQVRPNCSQPEVGSRGTAHEQQQPTGLEVFHKNDALEKRLMFSGFLGQKFLHELWLSSRSAKKFHPLVLQTQLGIASPDNGVLLDLSGCCSELRNPRWNNATSIPDLGFPKIQLDVRVKEQFFLQDGVHICNAVGLTNDVHVVEIRKQLLAFNSLALTASCASCCFNAKSRGMTGSPCSPPSPSATSAVVPISSSHS